jgi:hypothetical protein
LLTTEDLVIAAAALTLAFLITAPPCIAAKTEELKN